MEQKEKLLALLIIAIGFFLRVWRLHELMGFDYDQEVAAFAVKEILQGNLRLIGQEISVGGIFIGPAYYYVLAVAYLVSAGNPLGIGVLVAVIAVASMTLLFLVTRELYDNKTALIALSIYATSSRVNFYDRTTAPSNLVMFSALATLLFVIYVRKGKTRLTPAVFFVACLAAVHFHPSVFVLIPIIYALWRRWKIPAPSRSQVLLSLAAVVAVFSPLILFDLRHDLINTRGIIAALRSPGEEAYTFPLKLLTTTRIQIENFASLFAMGKAGIIAALGIISLIFIRKEKQQNVLAIWIALPALLFSFYSGHIPEYYFLVSLPAWVIVLARSIRVIQERFARLPALVMLAIIAFGNLVSFSKQTNPLGLKYKEEAVNYILSAEGENAKVSFDTDFGLDAGFRFLLQREGGKFAESSEQATHVIVIPPHRRTPEDETGKIFGGVKVLESPHRRR